MTHFLIYTKDKPDSLHIRQAARADHIDWLRNSSEIILKTAGPWLDENAVMRGSLLIVKAPSLQSVKDWLETDPYAKAGLTDSKEVKEFNWAIGAPA